MGVPYLYDYNYENSMYRNFLSKELKIKLEYIRNHYDIDENDYYIYDAIRQVL